MKCVRCLVVLSFAALAGCVDATPNKSLLVYCAAVARGPMEAIAERYEAEQGVRVELQFGGSNTLLGQARISGFGDLLLVADGDYVQFARDQGLVTQSAAVAATRAVLVVGNRVRDGVTGIDALVGKGVRLALADPEAAAIGRRMKRVLEEAGRWEDLKATVETRGVFMPTVTGVANAIEIGGADAGFVWEAIAASRDGLHVVETPSLPIRGVRSTIELAVLRSSTNADAALGFLEFVASRGGEVFAAHGFESAASLEAAR